MAIENFDGLALGIAEIDDQHAELFRVYNEFSAKVQRGRGLENLAELMAFLEVYIGCQFKYEELLINRSSYDGGDEHHEEHRQFAADLEGFKARLYLNGPTKKLLFSFKGFLVRWMISHIRHADRDLCDFLLELQNKARQELAGQKLGDILVEADLISPTTLERVLERQQGTGQKLGTLLEQMGVVGRQEISVALAAQEGRARVPKKLGSIVVESGLISQATLERALELQKESGKMLGTLLVEMGVISTEEIVEAYAVQQGILKNKGAIEAGSL